MPDTYKIEDWNKNEPMMMLICEAISGHIEDFPFNKEEVTVEFKINGVEVSFTDLAKKLMSVYKTNVYAAARELISEKAHVLTEKLQKMERISNDIEEHFNRELRQLVPECLTDEDYR
jgi:hypothetical protein